MFGSLSRLSYLNQIFIPSHFSLMLFFVSTLFHSLIVFFCSLGEGESQLPTPYQYKASLTPEVTSVSPARGGTAGGTRVTIQGQGFGTDQSAVSVSIGGSECIIAAFSSTSIECVTEARKPSIKTQVEVSIGDNGIAQQTSADFEYIDVWSSQFSWGGLPPPVEGDMVVIPKDMTILLDTDTPVLKMLLIQGAERIKN